MRIIVNCDLQITGLAGSSAFCHVIRLNKQLWFTKCFLIEAVERATPCSNEDMILIRF